MESKKNFHLLEHCLAWLWICVSWQRNTRFVVENGGSHNSQGIPFFVIWGHLTYKSNKKQCRKRGYRKDVFVRALFDMKYITMDQRIWWNPRRIFNIQLDIFDLTTIIPTLWYFWGILGDRRDRMVVGFTTTYAISVYYH